VAIGSVTVRTGRGVPLWVACFGLSALVACMQPPRMCGGTGDCGSSASCVAGRCVVHGATAAISTARRVLVAPVDVAYVRPGDAPGVPSIATLGGSDGGLLLVRFRVPLPAEATVLEAYLLLERATDVDTDSKATALHAVRVATPWDARALSWATRPRLEDVGAPVTLVPAASGPLVRLDVRLLVERWRRRIGPEFGFAVQSERVRGLQGPLGRGFAFALAPVPVPASRRDVVLSSLALPSSGVAATREPSDEDLVGPRLELYLR